MDAGAIHRPLAGDVAAAIAELALKALDVCRQRHAALIECTKPEGEK